MGFSIIFVKTKIFNIGIKTFHPDCPELLNILNQEIQYTIKERPKKPKTTIDIKPNDFLPAF